MIVNTDHLVMIAGGLWSMPSTVAEDKLCVHNGYISVNSRPYKPVFSGIFITSIIGSRRCMYISYYRLRVVIHVHVIAPTLLRLQKKT